MKLSKKAWNEMVARSRMTEEQRDAYNREAYSHNLLIGANDYKGGITAELKTGKVVIRRYETGFEVLTAVKPKKWLPVQAGELLFIGSREEMQAYLIENLDMAKVAIL